MTDKQIIVDGVDVSNFCLVCYYDNKTNELVRIEQYNDSDSSMYSDIESYEYGYNAKIVKPEEIIKQLKRKEQECERLRFPMQDTNYAILAKEEFEEYKKLKAENEELKKIIDEAKNSKLDLNSFFAIEAIVGEYQLEFDQLKADRKEALEQLEFVRTLNTVQDVENRKLSKTLTEIKEIAENGKRFAERYMITGEQKANVLTYANAILQKISEVEDGQKS